MAHRFACHTTPPNPSANIPPIVEIASPVNETVFQISNVSIVVNVASYFWIIDSVYYQADWQEGIHQVFGIQPNYTDSLNATITVSFTKIPIGNHTVMFFANTHENMHTNMTVTFTTEAPVAQSSPFQTMPIIALAIVATACLRVSLLLYRRHQKTKQVKKH